MHRVVVHLETVHIGHVAGIDAALHGLEVVALLQALGDEHVACRQGAPLDLRRGRHLVVRPHIGPHDPGSLDAGIGLDAHLLAKVRRRGNVDAFAGAGEFQAVIGAADAVLLVAAEIERDAAVRAELVDEADLAVGVAKCEEFLAENLHAHLRTIGFRDFPRQQNRHPIAAQKVSHLRARTGPHQGFRLVLFHRALLELARTERAPIISLFLASTLHR